MTQNHPPAIVPFLVACLGIATFSLMDVAMKDLSLVIGAYSAVLWRNIFGSMIAASLFFGTRQKWPAISVLKLHLWRSVIVSVMAVSFFWSLTKLPLAEAIGISFIAPVIALYLAAILLGEVIGRAAIFASLAGLGGVVIIIGGRLAGEYSSDALWGVISVLFSAIAFAYNLVLARKQAQQAGPIEIAFFQNIFVAIILLPFAPWLLEYVSLDKAPILAGAVMLAIISLLMFSWAYARAEAQILIPVEYTAFIWAVIFGSIFFDEAVTITTLLGTALIVVGSLIAARAKPAPVNQVEIANL